MPSNSSKYTPEIREHAVPFALESATGATGPAYCLPYSWLRKL